MKQLLFILTFLASFTASSQFTTAPVINPANPSTYTVPVLNGTKINRITVGNLTKLKLDVTSFNTTIANYSTTAQANSLYPSIQRLNDSLLAHRTFRAGIIQQIKDSAAALRLAIGTGTGGAIANDTFLLAAPLDLRTVDNSQELYITEEIIDADSVRGAIAGKQNSLGFTPENAANKVTTLTGATNITYASSAAVKTYVDNAIAGVTAGTSNTDSAIYATRERLYNSLDSLAATIEVPSGGGSSFGPGIDQMRALGSNIKAQAVYFTNPHEATTNTALSDGQARLIAMHLPSAQTITGALLYTATAGVFTADAFNGAALYRESGGVLTQVAITANDAGIWTSAGIKEVAFTTPYAASAGVYYLV
ncbi:MAG TPA: hypothetical protein VD794_02900, partial [Flavisolibacter sp.]|nr:hypothetical protein [Flavisolibacter sp.]